MEIARTEIEAVEKLIASAASASVVELDDLQLSLIGGGTGDIHFG